MEISGITTSKRMSQHSDSESTSFSKLKVDLVKDLVVDTLLSGFDDTD